MRRQALVENEMKERLLSEIREVRRSLETAHSNFQNASDPDLIDCYIYEMNAIHLRYKYLLRQMQSLQLTSKELNCKINS